MAISASSHSFTVPVDACNRCHSSTTHPAGNAQIKTPQTDVTGVMEAQQLTTRVKELESEVTDLEARVNSVRNLAVRSAWGVAPGCRRIFRPARRRRGDVAVARQVSARSQVRCQMNQATKLSRRQFRSFQRPRLARRRGGIHAPPWRAPRAAAAPTMQNAVRRLRC